MLRNDARRLLKKVSPVRKLAGCVINANHQQRNFATSHESGITNSFGSVRESCIKLKKIIDENKFDEGEKRNELIGNFLEYSKQMIFLIKLISQESVGISELKPIQPIQMGISIDGKDVLEIDQVTYLNFLRKIYLREFSREYMCSREKLIALMLLGIELIYSKNGEGLRIMAMFVRDYPRVKELYTQPYDGSIEKSWQNIIGKQYGYDEFDWINDLETDLPINLNGMYNIFNSITTKQSKGEIMDTCDKEIIRSPLNPYIPLIKGVLFSDIESINQSLQIMKQSKAANITELDRMQLYNLYNNDSIPTERINDLKFTPILFWKCHFENSNSSIHDWIHQLEYYSRFPTHYNLIQLGLLSAFNNKNYSKVLDFAHLLKHFESQIHPDDLLESMKLIVKSARYLNRRDEIKPVIENLTEKHQDFASLLQKLEEN